MISFDVIRSEIEAEMPEASPLERAAAFVHASEQVLENWIESHDGVPTQEEKEGSRLLALHRQGAKGDPSFNACRETCRELVYRYNVIKSDDPETDEVKMLKMMRLLARHIFFFISGKLQEAKLGEFCCSSKPLRLN